MDPFSLLEGYQNIIEKSHESWNSYFSKWETLAGLEGELPEDAFTSEEAALEEEGKKKKKPLKKKRKLKKGAKKNRNKMKGGVTKGRADSRNENLPEERDNKELEMHLRTIFMDILKANKNKWGVFAVLSQTFSQEDITIKWPHSLHPNHQRALPSNDMEEGGRLSRGRVEVFPLNSTGSGSGFSAADFVKKVTVDCIGPRIQNNTFGKFRFSTEKTRRPFGGRGGRGTFASPHPYPDSKGPPLPAGPRYNAIGPRPSPLALTTEIPGESEHCQGRNVAENGGRVRGEEKRSESLCLHKRTNGGGLNMEISNLVTRERNSPERKCFSENISQRKRRRPTKLFFDFWDSSDSENDEQTQTSTPRIGSRINKSPEIGLSQKMTNAGSESESDESDSIFDRVFQL